MLFYTITAEKNSKSFNPSSANPTKCSNTQIISRQFADELFECVRPFRGIGALRVKECSCDRRPSQLTFTLKVNDRNAKKGVKYVQILQ